jgi:hypothetical protein
MKATQKPNQIEMEQTSSTTAVIESNPMEPAPGGRKALQAITDPVRAASQSPMAIPYLGFDRLYLRLTGLGFDLPKVWFNPRICRDVRTVEWRSFPLTTPSAPELIAERWIREYMTRAIEPSGVASQRPLKIDADPIRRWLTKTA